MKRYHSLRPLWYFLATLLLLMSFVIPLVGKRVSIVKADNSYVYNVFPQYWDHNNLTVYISPSLNPTWQTQASQAVKRWTGVGTAISLTQTDNSSNADITIFEGSTDFTTCPLAEPGTIVIACTQNDGNASVVLGSTTPGLLKGVAIEVNPTAPSAINFYLVALHELGHAMGLAHSCANGSACTLPYYESAVMDSSYDNYSGDTDLTPYDINALWTKYPLNGTWASPVDGSSFSSSVHLAAHASAPSGNSIAHVDFTAFYNGSWHTVKSLSSPTTSPDLYEYDWNFSGVPAGSIPISFDVYGNARPGNVHQAPNGTRTITFAPGSSTTPTSTSTSTPTSTPPCTASGDGVTLFVDPNYGGSTCHTFGVGEYSDLSQFGLDQNVSSLQDTNAAYHITFFDQTGLTGTPGYYDANTPQLTGYWDNRARSMRVERHSTDGVTLCTDASYGGTCHTFGVGEYSDLSQFGLDQNVSSLQDTNAAYHITLFDQKGLTGTPGYYDADTSQLTGYWDNRARSMRVEMHSTDGVTLYVDGNYGGTSHTFGVGEYSDLSQFSLDQNVSSLRDTNAAYHITLFDQKGLTGTPGYYDADTSQLTGYWDNRARSMRVEKHRPTTCNPGTDGIIAYIDTNYQAGCLFITGDIPDLTTYNFEHVISSIRFAGNYTNSEQIAIYRQANYQDLCGTFSQDQPDLLSCSDQAVSVQVLPFTPPVTPTPSPTTTPSPTPTASCPSGWTCADIGGPNLSGSESLSNGTWSIQGSGGDIWNTSDQFHYDWQSLPGDGNVSAQILTQDNTDGWAKAGVMLRQDNTPGSAFYMVALTPGNGITVQYRADQGASAQMNAQISGGSPVYLQVIRVGNTFTAATSSDGISWNTISGSSATLNVSGTMLAGLAITSHSASLGTATFNSVNITQATPTSTPTPSPTPIASCPSGWTCADIGNPNLSGSESLNNNTWTVQGSGGDIWNTADQFHYDWQSLSGDCSVSAQILTQDNTDSWAKAGVMLRQDNTPGSAFYMIALTPGNGITVQYRTDQGVSAQMNAQISGTAPIYVMAVRAGNTFTAATSPDGVTWTTVSGSSATLNVNGAMLAGLAVTSHSASLGTVTFNSVSITTATSPSPTPSPSPTATTPTPTPTTSPTPTSTGVELLPAPWHLSGNNGASELYQSIDPNALNGMTRVQITYNLHGLQALGNDASAIIIDQNGWHYISLSNYGQNGLDGNQTVIVPLSDFGLDLTQPIDGTIHTRFWYGSQFTVDIISIQLLP